MSGEPDYKTCPQYCKAVVIERVMGVTLEATHEDCEEAACEAIAAVLEELREGAVQMGIGRDSVAVPEASLDTIAERWGIK